MTLGVTSIDHSASIKHVQSVSDAADKIAESVKVLDELREQVEDCFTGPSSSSGSAEVDQARSERVVRRLGTETSALEAAGKRLGGEVTEAMNESMRRFEKQQAAQSS